MLELAIILGAKYMNLPESSELDKPYLIGRDVVEAKESFYELAKQRITYRSEDDHIKFEKSVFGHDWEKSSAVYVLSRKGLNVGENERRIWVTGLEISINTDFFGEDNKDLIPYAIEHEIYEMWLWTKPGISPQSSETNHLLARRRQVEMALKDGKAEKLISFYKELNPLFADELDYAYKVAQRKTSNK